MDAEVYPEGLRLRCIPTDAEKHGRAYRLGRAGRFGVQFSDWRKATINGLGMLVLDGDWIDQLYVDPDLTGGGIGAELIAVARRERPDGLRLWTFVSNQGPQRFYLRHGFHEVERTNGSRTAESAPDIPYAWSNA